MPVRTKRWNDPIEPDDGFRVLVCRYRPRGVRSEGEPWDAWCPALAPSPALHADVYGKNGDPITWDAYEKRFLIEMRPHTFWLEGFAKKLERGETLTLLCSSACVDEARCHRTLVKRLIEAIADKPTAPAGPVGVRSRKPRAPD